MRFGLFAIFLLGCFEALFAQNYDGQTVLLDGSDSLKSYYASFQPELAVSKLHEPEYLHRYLHLQEDYSLRPIRSVIEDSFTLHIRYQLLYRGVPIVGSEIISHRNANGIRAVNGHLYQPQNFNLTIDDQQAVQSGLQFISAEQYAWEDSNEQSRIKEWTGDTSATFFPKPTLVFAPKDLNFKEEFELCYVFDIYTIIPHGAFRIYVNAQSGMIWATEDRIHIIDATGTAQTRYSGQQQITVDSLSANSFRLREVGRGGGIETYNLKTSTSYAAATDFTDSDNYWDNSNTAQDEIATDAHWGAEWTYDYYWNKFARNSYDGNGAKIRSYVHYGKKYNNAFWNGYVMTYGDGDSNTFTPLTSIDVCGHEITHAVTSNTAALIYKNESGALNESFSDIFGNSIEFYAKPTLASWVIGEDITPNGSGIRHMHNPKGKGHPDTYKGAKWRTGTADNGGVHSNSGVQNYWYYLLCEGGTGTNDNGDVYSVDSIGILKAEMVAYRNLTVYLTASSDYADARFYAIRAAEDLFGSCSDEVIAVTNAWYAVGVGDKYDSSLVVADFAVDSAWCYPNQLISFTNRSQNASAYHWDFGDGDTSTWVNPQHQYNSYGSFSVELIAEGCFTSTFDTSFKFNHIIIDSTRDVCNSVWMTAGRWDTVERCTGFIYDDGGPSIYQTQIRDTLTVVGAPCDSITLTFSTFDFEDGYDSLYIYDGPNTSSPLIGGYTGNELANGGKISAYSGYITLRQFADPFVTGDGFKAELNVYRDPLQVDPIPDTTVCNQQEISLVPNITGGAKKDYRFFWNGYPGDSLLNLKLVQDSIVTLVVEEYCTKELHRDTVSLTVRDPLHIDDIPDTTICFRQVLHLNSGVTGGDTANRVVNWIPLGINADSLSFSSDTTLKIKAIASDGCTPFPDSTEFWVTVRQPLKLTVSSDTQVCYNSEVKLIAEGTGGLSPLQYEWDNGLGVGSRKTDYPLFDTMYRVVLHDNCSGWNDTAFISVDVMDSISISTSPDKLLCYREAHQLQVKANGGDSTQYSYTWNPDLGNKPDPQIFPEQDGTYYITVSDGCTGQTATDSVRISVEAPLSIGINGSDIACYGEQMYFTSTASGGKPGQYTYRWSHAMGNLSSANTNAVADTTITLVLNDGCSEPDTASFKLSVLDALDISTISDSTICSGDTLSLWAVGTGGKSNQYVYFWDNGGGNGQNVVVAPKFTTKYRVILNDNCSSYIQDSVTITVNPTPKVSYSIDEDPQCSGEPVHFRNLTPNAIAHTNNWWFGDGDTSSEFEPVHTYKDEGTYRVRLIVTNSSGCSDSSSITDLIEIIPAPVAFFEQTPEVATVVDPFFNLINKSQHASKYQWTFGDGFSDTITDAFHIYADTGHYEVRLTARNYLGCMDEYSKVLWVKDVYLSHIPNAFTPDDDQLNDRFLPFIKGLLDYRLEIYDRWGNNLFVSEDARFGWDGRDQGGTKVPSGHYLYIITGRSVDGDLISESGLIQVLR